MVPIGAARSDSGVRDAIRGARRARRYPHECCGALLGRDGARARDRSRCPTPPTKGRAAGSWSGPTDYRDGRAAQRARRGLDLLGFYHSHPDHPARPSQYDLDHAWPFFSYVIVSVMAGEPAALTSWRLSDDRSAFDEEPLIARSRRRHRSVAERTDPCRIEFTSPRRSGRSPASRTSSKSPAPPSASCWRDLTRQFDGLKKHLYTDEGRLRSFVNIYVNDEDIRYLQKEQTPVKPGDTVSIIPSVAGGVGAARGRSCRR